MMTLYVVSRNFVVIGLFTGKEIASFKKRGVFTDTDYLRSESAHNWETIGQWIVEGSPEKTTAKKITSVAKNKSSAKVSKKID